MNRIVLGLGLGLLTACGVQDGDTLPSAPASRDAGTRDAGSTSDSGVAIDAGAGRDAGQTGDAGQTHDGGQTRDGGTGSPDGGGATCASLQRDVCIATPGCVLDGSENLDPAYFCRDARSPCEQIADPMSCDAAADCTFVPGACYCPEGQDCLCGGGTGPVCREFCGGFAGVECPGPSFFCDLPQQTGPNGPACSGNSDQLGLCTPFPPTCQGTPPGPVCGCNATFDPVDFPNDCERRSAGAHRSLFRACP